MSRRRFVGADGQAVPLVAALVALAVVVVLAVGALARDVGDATRARSAADAAALAGVARGRAGSQALAARNGATVVSWQRDGGGVTVTVRVGRATATARATGG
jgi:hypothetical protein